MDNSAKTIESANFEEAISKTQFGFFNLLLILVTIPSIFASQVEVSALSYAFPATQCDLNLTLEDRGLINAVVYAGMIGSSFFWGPLGDVIGRRKILIIAHLSHIIFLLITSFAPNFTVLVVVKFFGGLIVSGPTMALTPYLSEFHGTYYRSRVPLMLGLLYNTVNIIIPLIAWAVLPIGIEINLFGTIQVHSWNLFMFICAVPAMASGIFFILMPESPKYLMSKGYNDEALEVFQKIFSLNTRRPKEEYPIKKLIDDKHIYQKDNSFKDSWNQISPLFTIKYLTKLLLVCLEICFLMMGINSLRLWLPEIFQVVNDYKSDNNVTSSFCQMLGTIHSIDDNEEATCLMNFDNSSVYINSVIVGLISVVGYLGAALCINKIGKKRILISLCIISSISAESIYFAPNSQTALVLICIYIMCSCICVDTTIVIIVDIFPTYLRATALSLALMCGRLGSVSGNLLMPILLQAGCAAPFLTLGSVILGIISGMSSAATYFAPNTFTALIMICILLASARVCVDTVIAALVDIFPTYLRALAFSVALGNFRMPVLLQAGCTAPFFSIEAVLIGENS